MQVAIVGDVDSGPDEVCELLSNSGFQVGSVKSNSNQQNSEYRSLYSINSRLLARLGWSDDHPRQISLNWADHPSLANLYTQARQAIEHLNSTHPNWAWYDTATNITAAFWNRANSNTQFAVCVRNPHDIVALREYVSATDRSFAYAKWHWLYLHILSSIPSENRFTAIYECVLESLSKKDKIADPFDAQAMSACIARLVSNNSDMHSSGSIKSLAKDSDIHDAARRLYLGMLRNDDSGEVEHQLEAKDVLLSMLHPILDQHSAYHAMRQKCVELDHELRDLNRSLAISTNLGRAFTTKMVHITRRSKALISGGNGNVKDDAGKAKITEIISDYAPPKLARILERPNAKKIIVCAGHYRSGSTWLFNVVRCAHMCAGLDTYGAWVEHYLPTMYADVHVIKTHNFNQDMADYADFVAVSKRDMRDCAASFLRKEWLDSSADAIHDRILSVVKEEILPWRKCANIIISYEEMTEDKVGTIKSILSSLGLTSVDPVEVNHWTENLPHEVFHQLNPISLLHPHHVTDGSVRSFEKTLNSEQIEAVKKACEEFESELDLMPA